MSESKEVAGLPLPHSLHKCSTVLPMQSLYITRSTNSGICLPSMGSIHAQEQTKNVQKYALRITSGRWSASYEELLDLFKIPTLASRREYLRVSTLHHFHTHHSYIPSSWHFNLTTICFNPFKCTKFLLVEKLNIVGERERPKLGLARYVRAA